MEYTFTLKYQLSPEAKDIDLLIEKLAEAGCEDALIGTGRAGRLGLEFTREATSAKAAVQSAIENIHQAMPDARLVEAAPDFVGLTDIAEILGVTRQAVRKLMLSHQHSFPLPVHEGSIAIWHLAEVLDWFEQRDGYELQAPLKETAQAVRALNAARPQLAA
jgi:predicted DNA-binding transcriptional regulator AlpA